MGGNNDDNGIGAVWVYSISSLGIWTEETKLVNKNCHKFGSNISSNYNGSVVAIGTFNSIHVFTYLNKCWELSEIVSNTNINIQVDSFSMNLNGNKLLVAYGGAYKLLLYKKTNDGFVIKHDLSKSNLHVIQKILSCCMCENSKTIIVSGISKTRDILVSSLTMKNNTYEFHTIARLDCLPNDSLQLSMSSCGNILIFGTETINDYTGSCTILS